MSPIETGPSGKCHATAFRIYGEPLLMTAALVTTIQSLAGAWRDRYPDFNIFYAASDALRQGLDPYTSIRALENGPNANPPAVIWAMIPLTWIPTPVAAALWIAIGLVALCGSLRMVARALFPIRAITLGAIVLATQAGATAIRLGQITFLLLPFLTLAWLADRRQQSSRTGMYLGVLIYVKPFYGLYAVYLLWRRDFRAVVLSIGTFAACVLVGLMAGFSTYWSWMATLWDVQWHANILNVSARGLAARVFNAYVIQPYPTYTPFAHNPRLEIATYWFIVVLIVGVSGYALRKQHNCDQEWATLGVVALLLSPLGWIYYLPMTIGPIAATFQRNQRWVPAWIAGLLLAVPHALLAMGHYGRLGTTILGSLYFWGAATLWLGLVLPTSDRRAGDRYQS